MLLQSHHDIHLLPALPDAWPSGSVKGLRARGGYGVSLEWRAGTLVAATIESSRGGKRNVRYRDRVITIKLKPGAPIHLDSELTISTA
jgi:alpha-L-fucosidase 2